MKLTPIIAALRARCPLFENRVGGAAQFKAIPEAGKLRLPAAYVVPSEDVTGEQKSQTDYWQDLTEGFSVIVVLSNERDEKGQWASYDAVHDVRQLIWKALLGWEPDPQAHEIQYAGGMLLDLNRHELYYQSTSRRSMKSPKRTPASRKTWTYYPTLKRSVLMLILSSPVQGQTATLSTTPGLPSRNNFSREYECL